jgi:hypothetical protein
MTSPAALRFRATVILGGKTATGFEVPDDVVEALGRGKRPPVRVTVGDHTYRSTIAVMGGAFLLPLSAENREAAGVAAGDEVDVTVELDDAPREIEVPPDLAIALRKEKEAKAFFESLSYSRQRWFTESITSAKKPETRARRVAKAVEMLRERRAGN